MIKLDNLISRFESFDLEEIAMDSLREVSEEIIDLNAYHQLYELGVDSEGRSLGEYTTGTIYIKTYERTPSQRVDHVTLSDTEYFYESLSVLYGPDFFLIRTDDPKYGKLVRAYGDNILGLTEESIDWLRDYIREDVINRGQRKLRA